MSCSALLPKIKLVLRAEPAGFRRETLRPSTAATTGDQLYRHMRNFPQAHSYGDQKENYLFLPVTTSFVFVECLCR